MAAFSGDFEEVPEEEFSSRPLPPEDRLWRHPSELGNANPSIALDPVAVRRRWLASQPSRASAWTAGLVGAILATGLVALGTHLAGAFTGHTTVGAASPPIEGTIGPFLPRTSTPKSDGLGSALRSSIWQVGEAIAVVDVMHGTTDHRFLALVVRHNGILVAPAAYVRGGTTTLVTLSDNVSYVASVVASDSRSGLAVLRINGATDLPAVKLGSAEAVIPGSFALAITGPGGSTYDLGTVRKLDTQLRVDGRQLADTLLTDLPARSAPPGSAVIDSSGAVVGMVAGSYDGRAVAVPSWVAGPVTSQLLADRAVDHGWLGITGKTVNESGFSPAGVLVQSVVAGSAAGEAGLRVGDIITSVGAQPVDSLVGLLGHLYGVPAGAKLTVGIDRGSTDLFYYVYLQQNPPG